MAAPILISVLGPLKVQVEGRATAIGGPRQVAVLARLVVAEGRPVAPETLADDVWRNPEAIDAARMAASRLRQTIGADAITTGANGYALDRTRCRTDAELFEDLLGAARRHPDPPGEQAARYEEALAPWRGDAFVGLRDMEVCLAEGERLDELRLSAIGEWVDARLRTGESATLISDLERLAHEHPWRERITEQLMLALYRAGRQREALNAFHRLERTLREELGIEPNPRARALHAAVLAQAPELDLVVPVASDRGEAIGMSGAPEAHRTAFVGRHDEIDRLLREWRRVVAESRARAVVVAGAPGIGKSRLLDHVAAMLAANGDALLRSTCAPDDRVPFQAMADALRPFVIGLGDRVLDPELESLAAVLPGVGSLPLVGISPTAEPSMRRAVVRRSVERTLRLCVDAQPTALVIDDLQWIDAGSLAFLTQVWPSMRDQPLLLVLGCRSNELAVEGPITRFLSAVTERSPATTIELAGLAPSDTRQMVSDLLPADWTGDLDALSESIASTASGHPFFVHELVCDLLDSDGVGTPLGGAVPSSLVGTIRHRIDRLGTAERALLNVAAVIGPVVPADLLGSVVGRTPAELTDDAGAAVRAGMLRPTVPAPGYAFEHSMIRQVLLEEMAPVRRARLHASIGEALETAGARPEELSHHFVNAIPFIEPERAARAALEAGDTAMEASAYEDATAHFQRALEVLASTAPDPELRIRILVALGNALATGTEAEPALHCFEEAIGLARGLGLAELFAEALGGRAQFGVRHEDRDLEIERVDAAVGMLTDRESWVRERVLLWGAWLLLYSDDHRRAEPYVEEAMRIGEHLADPHALAAALQVRHAFLVAGLAPLDERDVVRKRIRELPSKLTRYEGTLINGASAFDDLVEHGDLDLLRAELDRYRRDADEVGRPYDRWSARSIRFVVKMWTGDLDGADVAMSEAASLGRALGVGVAEGAASAHTLLLAWERDQLALAVPVVEAMIGFARNPTYFKPVLAIAYHAAGRDDDACRVVRELREGFPEVVHPQERSFICAFAAETLHLAADDQLTCAIERGLEPYSGRLFVAPTAIYTLGPYDRMLGLCALARGDLDLAVERLSTGRRLAQKYGLVLWEPRAAAVEADARLRRGGRGDVDAARELLELTDRAASRIGSPLLERMAAEVRARHRL